MAKKPRYLPPEPSRLVEVSNRTVGSRYLLKPSKVARERIAGVLARAADRHGVQVVFYVFASTHFHLLLIVDTTEQMADFMEILGSNIARELGRLYEWRQKFWGQPYSHVPVSEEPAGRRGSDSERLSRLFSTPTESPRSIFEKEIETRWFQRELSRRDSPSSRGSTNPVVPLRVGWYLFASHHF